MVNKIYISLILLLLMLVTVVNLYYKPYLPTPQTRTPFHEFFSHPVTKSVCPLQGFKCPQDELCDCHTFCKNGGEYIPFRVLHSDSRIFVMNQQLEPGTYCLPRGIDQCNLQTSYHIFSLSGWACLPQNSTVFYGDKSQACQNDEALDNTLNVLWDFRMQSPVTTAVDDFYEQWNGALRYQCKCDSKSLDGTPLVSSLPFVCSVDYCLRDIPNPLPFMGWDGDKCQCGPYFHLNTHNETSPCVLEKSRIEQDAFIGRVDCMTQHSFHKKTLYCPSDDASPLTFTEFAIGETDPIRYLKQVLPKIDGEFK